MIHQLRIKMLNDEHVNINGKYVLYIMQNSQRADFNHALEYTIECGNEYRKPVLVLFGLTPDYPDANIRHYQFMLDGIKDTATRLNKRNIGMIIRKGSIPYIYTPLYHDAAMIVLDRGYLRFQNEWRDYISRKSHRRTVMVESDVVVPVEVTYHKEAYSAGILRPKIHENIDEYLHPLTPRIPFISSQKLALNLGSDNIDLLQPQIDIVRSVSPVSRVKGGTTEAHRLLNDYIDNQLDYYHTAGNDPGKDVTSGLSPYLHFGQISPVDIALRIKSSGRKSQSIADFLEQLIVRRELAINFTFYNPAYDDYECLPDWAKRTLHAHRDDPRDYIYSLESFEAAETHDPYWNAAMKEMIHSGRMHNYMRMYWGKKVLEWSEYPEQAYQILIHLNNKYLLDGRDPNGYAGVAWCFGKHDRAWKVRPVFGKTRYMNSNGLERKFDMASYLKRIEELF